MKFKFSSPDALLLLTTFFWGWSFLVVKWSMTAIDPYFFVCARFALAFTALLLIFGGNLKKQWRACLMPGIRLGLLLSLAFLTQTVGIKYTTASASGFITGMNVILVAIFAAIGQRRLPTVPVLIGIAAASAGLILITWQGNFHFQLGDLLTLACAVLFAWHIICTEQHAQNCPASVLTLIQFAVVTVLSGLAFCLLGRQELPFVRFTTLHWLAILYNGLFSTALAYLFQTKAQQQIPSFRTAIIFATEPLFAGIFAIGLRFDPFSWKIVFGGLLIFSGMILAAGKPQPRNERYEVRNGM